MLLAWMLAGVGPIAAQTDGSVELQATLFDLSGNGDDHWTVVWVTTASGGYVDTLWKQGPSMTRSSWNSHCRVWYGAKGSDSEVALDGYSAGTARNYSPPNSPVKLTWDCRDAGNQLVADGDYRFWIQYAEDTSHSVDGPATSGGLLWTKGPAAATKTYPDQPQSFSDMSVTWTPSVPAIRVEQPVGVALAPGGTVDFGTVAPGGVSALTFRIRNPGDAELTGIVLTIDGPDASGFSLNSTPPATLEVRGTSEFGVSFAPATTGANNAVLHIASNDPEHNPFNVALTGIATSAYQEWAGAAGLPSGRAGPLDIAYHDGVTNLMKFACNLDGSRADSRRLEFGGADTSGLPDGASVADRLRIEYLRRKESTNPGVTYMVQFSGDVASWSDFTGAPVSVSSIDDTWERVVVEDPAPAGQSTRFGRLVVTLDP